MELREKKKSKKNSYQMQHRACKCSVNREAYTSLHVEEALQAVLLENGFLQATHILCSRIADHHVLLPVRIVDVVEIVMQLGPVVHNDTQVVIDVKVGDIMGGNPWAGAVSCVYDLKILREFAEPCHIVLVVLDEFWVDHPILLLFLEADVHRACILDVLDDSGKVHELSPGLLIRVIRKSRDAEVDRV